MIHDYKLRPYHNPEGVDESLVPAGWRMLYEDEFPRPWSRKRKRKCRLFIPSTQCFGSRDNCTGHFCGITYIVPVTP
jgi:hypothetical protein